MKPFAQLFRNLDSTNSTQEKIRLLTAYFQDDISEEDKVSTLALFMGRRPPRPVKTSLLRSWASEISGVPLWLLEENYHIVGDLAETLALILPPPQDKSDYTLSQWLQHINNLRGQDAEYQREKIIAYWNMLDATERFLFTKLITGGFRVGVSDKLVMTALAHVAGTDLQDMMLRLTGNWTAQELSWQVIMGQAENADISRPYPFYLGYPLDESTENELIVQGEQMVEHYQAEWKWDGIRAQLISRNQNIYLWSRGEEIITEAFPEFGTPELTGIDFVLDGEIIVYKDDKPGDFGMLQKRLGRKKVPSKMLKELPCRLVGYDILEYMGSDIRHLPWTERRTYLEQIIQDLASPHLALSPLLEFRHFEDLRIQRDAARQFGAEGLMLKRSEAPYYAGRKRGSLWKWKLDPFTIDAVMIYAQRGHGRRANLYSDFTFAVWDNQGQLIPFTKAYSGLSDAEMKEVNTFVRKNTLANFGPVCSVTPQLVFELAFEGIQLSTRNKSGIAVRFPRIKNWRRDKPADQANTLEDLHQMMHKKEF